MSLPNRYDLTINQGETLKRWYAVRYPDGSLANLVTAGYTIGRLTIRDTYGGTEQLVLTTSNGGVSVTQEADANAVTWSGYIYASPATTAALTDFGEGVFDLEIDNGSDVIRVMEGIATLSREATT